MNDIILGDFKLINNTSCVEKTPQGIVSDYSPQLKTLSPAELRERTGLRETQTSALLTSSAQLRDTDSSLGLFPTRGFTLGQQAEYELASGDHVTAAFDLVFLGHGVPHASSRLTALDMYAVEDGLSYQPISTIVSEIINDLSPMMQQDGFTFEEEVVTSSEQDSTERFVELQVLSADTNPMWGCQKKEEPTQFRPVYSPDGYRMDQDFCIPTNSVFSAQSRGYRPDGYDSDGMTPSSGSESPASSRSSSASSDDDEDYVPLEISDDEEEAEDEVPSPKWPCRYNPGGFHTRIPSSPSKRRHGQPILWKFLYEMLMDPQYSKHIYWTNQSKGMFKFASEKKEEIARMWGEKKGNRCVMTYQKMARSLRNYSNQKRHLVKVKRKLQYQFLSDSLVARA
ncbi:hypothetical protein Bbelb_371510 [Branchiostoma belcheri]|nr:hypothetical protein Bbelb_371510 [Branchiostoma belcheri]